MAFTDTSRKRRKIEGQGGVDSAVAKDGKSSSAVGLFLDDDAIRRSMLDMMTAKRTQQAVSDDEDDDNEGSDSSGDDEEEEEEEEAQPNKNSGEKQQVNENEHATGASDQGHELSLEDDGNTMNSPAASRVPLRRVVNATLDKSQAPLKRSFESLGLLPPLISALASISINKPTEIQSACIGPILSGRDCIGGAKTGSGKTMAFALPILQRIHRDPFGIFAVVLTPTRELAYQLSEQFLVLGKPLGLTTVTVVGGMDMMQQAKDLCAKPHVVVATPGRLCDLLKSGGGAEWDLMRVKTLVLDEADRLLSPTFASDLQYLFSNLPADRQTCLFTATISPAIEALAERPPRKGKQKPFIHRVKAESLTVATLKQNYLFIPSQIRDPYLYHLLLNPPKSIAHLRKRKAKNDDDDDDDPMAAIPSTIIFTQRCATAQLLHLILTELSIPSVPLHSHLTQPQRLLSLAQFRAGAVPVLVTTDVGSRGLDIPEVSMVVNWDCPRTAEDYVHRVGRTARAGRGGVAVTIITERDIELIKGIEDSINVKLAELDLPEETVLNKLNVVSTARRVATMAMHDSGFGERQKTNKVKAGKRQQRDALAASAA